MAGRWSAPHPACEGYSSPAGAASAACRSRPPSARRWPSGSCTGRPMPDDLAVLQEDELAAVAVDQRPLVVAVEQPLLAGRPPPALHGRWRVGLDRVELRERRRQVGLPVDLVEVDGAEPAIGRDQ